MKYERVFLFVLDSLGIGNAPDAADFGDEGSNTLKSVAETGILKAPNLRKLGLFNIEGAGWCRRAVVPVASYGRCFELSKGKDTTVGHFEIAGIISERPFPTYPNGFPEELMKKITDEWGIGYLCNRPYSGTEVIKEYGKEHIETGKPIVYTSADSVFQIAAHESVISTERLYELCRIARAHLDGENRVARVIARPFTGEYPDYVRTQNRHDYSVKPTRGYLLDKLAAAGYDVIGVGKIGDIFAGEGITQSYPVKGNKSVAEAVSEIAKRSFHGLCFANFVDFDMLYGHRNDADGYASALSNFDLWLGKFMSELKSGDLLIITADHGCDPKTPSTDHSREAVPLLVYAENLASVNLETIYGFDKIGIIAADALGMH